MIVRLPCLLVLAALLPACVHRSPEPAPIFPNHRPEVEIHAPLERVRLSIITQEKGEGATLTGQSARCLVFVTRSSDPVANVLSDVRPAGPPYLRATYTLATGDHGTRVALSSEIVSDYGTDAERARPLDTPSLRRIEQRNLLRVQASVEKQP